jgi:hypothetical protein
MKSFKQFLNKRVLSVSALAKKHGVDKEYIERQLKRGIRVEHEHTTKLAVARRIALAHLGEDPDYYKKLRKVESKKQLHESDRPHYQKLDNVFAGRMGQATLRRVFERRKRGTSDLEIGKTLGQAYGGGTPYNSHDLRKHLEKYKDHPNYVKPANDRPKPNPEEFTHTVVGLHSLGHSASTIAKMLHKDERPVTRNKVIGIIDRNRERKDEIVSHINSGNEPPEYVEHKDKPVTVNKGGKPSWNTYKRHMEILKKEGKK